MTKTFVFSFYDEDAETSMDYAFPVYGEEKDVQQFVDNNSKFEDFVSESEEKYGVHDVSCDTYLHFIGYTSYEIDKKFYEECIQGFHTFFKENGFGVGDIQKIFIDKDDDQEEKEQKLFNMCQTL